MRMAVVQVGVVDVGMPCSAVAMAVGRRLGQRIAMRMVEVAVIVRVAVIVFERFVQMAVLVAFGQMQP